MAEERQDAGARTSSDGAPAFPWAEVAVRIRPFVASRVAPRDVDDVVQDTLLRLVANIDALRDPSRRPGWVRRVAQSAGVDHHRKMGRTPTAKAVHCEPPQLETLISAEARDEDEAHDTRAEELLGAWTKLVIGTLAEPYRTALTHVELEGMSQVDAARRAGVG
ncbi:MAG: sigma factor, partial [Myxococcota bacterium]